MMNETSVTTIATRRCIPEESFIQQQNTFVGATTKALIKCIEVILNFKRLFY
jgi:hypothetical protein